MFQDHSLVATISESEPKLKEMVGPPYLTAQQSLMNYRIFSSPL